MKIFFHSSIFAKQKYGKNYKDIVEICQKLGHIVFADHMLNRTFYDTDKFSRKEHEEDFQKLTSQIRNSDAVIIEGTSPSIGTGHYMTIALNNLKPVLVLYQKNPHGVLVGDPNRLLTLKKYSADNKVKLKAKIKQFLSRAEEKKLKNRFNLMMDDEMISYLVKKSNELNISKADVIRNLLVQKIRKG